MNWAKESPLLNSNYDGIKSSVNGKGYMLPNGTTLSDLVALLGLSSERVAIEVNRKIISSEYWSNSTIPNGAEIEIVSFVGGG